MNYPHTQIFCPSSPWDPEKLKIEGDIQSVLFKPLMGTFWTSSIVPDERPFGDWFRWCSSEMPSRAGRVGALFEVVGDPKIAVIDTRQAWKVLAALHPLEDPFAEIRINLPTTIDGAPHVDFASVARTFDAVWMADPCADRFYDAFYRWDAESTAWFNLKHLRFLQTIELPGGTHG